MQRCCFWEEGGHFSVAVCSLCPFFNWQMNYRKSEELCFNLSDERSCEQLEEVILDCVSVAWNRVRKRNAWLNCKHQSFQRSEIMRPWLSQKNLTSFRHTWSTLLPLSKNNAKSLDIFLTWLYLTFIMKIPTKFDYWSFSKILNQKLKFCPSVYCF